jgi:FAD/FMN-containing dehydrogenase
MAGATALDETAFADLARGFAGQLVRPDDAAYDEHRRVWNGSIDRRPALIARCASVDDAVSALSFARRCGLRVAVRGGGHSFPGASVCDDGVVIDFALMKAVAVDPEARTATVEAGALLGELDQATQRFGLAVPSGIVTHTGVAGLTLGGGIGWIMRKHGLSIDRLMSVDVVTAEGERVRAAATENPDLFWGVRGGAGNFGIVTRFEFEAVELGPAVVAGPVFWPMEKSPEVLRFYREWIADAPNELMTIVIHRRAPAVPFVPQELHGKHVVAVACCYSGRIEDGERAVAPLKAFDSPVLDLCVAKPYLDHQAMFDPSYPHGRWYYMRSCDVAELSDEVIDITVEHSLRIRSPLTAFPIWQLGGAVSEVADADTAFHGRAPGHTFNITSCTADADGFDEEREWARDFWSALAPYHQGVYVNFLMDEGEDRVREAYGAEKYERLKALKRRWDPANVFSSNQNIPPG